jgi:hypothetical protein
MAELGTNGEGDPGLKSEESGHWFRPKVTSAKLRAAGFICMVLAAILGIASIQTRASYIDDFATMEENASPVDLAAGINRQKLLGNIALALGFIGLGLIISGRLIERRSKSSGSETGEDDAA